MITNKKSLLTAFILVELLIISTLFFPENPSHYNKPSTENSNIILITFDALSANYLFFYGFDKETAPHLKNFSRESYVFTNATSQSGTTSISLCSLFSSRYPYTDNLIGEKIEGVAYIQACKKNELFLSRLFQGANYSTYAIISNRGAGSPFGFSQAFNYFFEGRVSSNYYAEETFNRAEEVVKNKARSPFFLWIHNNEPHLPYLPPEKYFWKFYDNKEVPTYYSILSKAILNNPNLTYSKETHLGRLLLLSNETKKISDVYDKNYGKYHFKLKNLSETHQEYEIYGKVQNLSDEELKQTKARYLGNIRYADEYFGKFLQQLKKQPFYNNTIIIVSADHGESMGEHNIFGHNHLYQDIIHVPLLIHLPGQDFKKEIDAPVELVDIYPTLLSLLDLNVEHKLRGENLFAEKRNKTFQFSEYPNKKILVKDKVKYWEKEGELFFYNLSQDPNETRKIYLPWEEKERIFNLTTLPANIFLPQNKTKVNEELKQKLREGGYWEKGNKG